MFCILIVFSTTAFLGFFSFIIAKVALEKSTDTAEIYDEKSVLAAGGTSFADQENMMHRLLRLAKIQERGKQQLEENDLEVIVDMEGSKAGKFKETVDVAEENEEILDIAEETEYIAEDSVDIAEEIVDIAEETEYIAEESVDFAEESVDFAEKIVDFTEKTVDIAVNKNIK